MAIDNYVEDWIKRAKTPALHALRRKAVKRLPSFGEHMSDHERVTQDIDNGMDPVEAVALSMVRDDSDEKWDAITQKPGFLDNPLLRPAIEGVGSQTAFSQAWPSAAIILSQTPQHLWPQTPQDWRELASNVDLLGVICMRSGKSNLEALQEVRHYLTSTPEGRWEKLGRFFESDTDSYEYANDFVKQVIAPLLATRTWQLCGEPDPATLDVLAFRNAILHSGLMSTFLSPIPIYKLSEANIKYHEHVVPFHHQVASIKPNYCHELMANTFPRLTDVLTMKRDGITDGWAVPLTTPDSLLQVGRFQKHCLGGYSPQCRTGKTFIYALVSPTFFSPKPSKAEHENPQLIKERLLKTVGHCNTLLSHNDLTHLVDQTSMPKDWARSPKEWKILARMARGGYLSVVETRTHGFIEQHHGFNNTPASYQHSLMADQLTEMLKERGESIPGTFTPGGEELLADLCNHDPRNAAHTEQVYAFTKPYLMGTAKGNPTFGDWCQAMKIDEVLQPALEAIRAAETNR